MFDFRENRTKKVMSDMRFRPKAIFYIAFALFHFPSIVRGYSLTVVIKDATNGESVEEAIW